MLKQISVSEGQDLIEKNLNNADLIILDLRTSNEFSVNHLANSVNLNFYSKNFRTDLDKLDKSKKYLIYCRSGQRSGVALGIMEKLGFQTVYDFGGILTWIEKGLPVTM